MLSYTRIENKADARKFLFFIMWLLYVQLLRGKKRYGLVCAVLINPPEMTKLETKHIAKHRCATVSAQKTKRELVMHHKMK